MADLGATHRGLGPVHRGRGARGRGKFADEPLEAFDTGRMAEFGAFLSDADYDSIDENYAFERKPLYVQVNPEGGSSFRILGWHLKSKGIFGAYEWSKWWQIADANRRKILAQATWIRLGFLDPYMTKPRRGRCPSSSAVTSTTVQASTPARRGSSAAAWSG